LEKRSSVNTVIMIFFIQSIYFLWNGIHPEHCCETFYSEIKFTKIYNISNRNNSFFLKTCVNEKPSEIKLFSQGIILTIFVPEKQIYFLNY